MEVQPLVFIAGCGLASDVVNVSIDAEPLYSSSCQLPHSLHAKVTQVQNLEDLQLHCCWDHHPVSVQETAVSRSQGVSNGIERLRCRKNLL
ncbi:hypothetical protein PoB_002186800 [Plakobranchus ocellatus]|uniref:Uncharacterized protein n=1 Tax=Plakobranchus ocellatus TaxID=259542 RepID=A0AAV3ZLN2_9GAST|nr:hypothetical protein PoB_002186800 [Plakobranchus ocellatus]